MPEPDLLATERFLLNLFHLLRRTDARGRVEDEPEWLAGAREAFADPRHLGAGVARLVQLAGCSPEHLARTVRRIHGITPTDLVNRQRLDWAAGELMFSPVDRRCRRRGWIRKSQPFLPSVPRTPRRHAPTISPAHPSRDLNGSSHVRVEAPDAILTQTRPAAALLSCAV